MKLPLAASVPFAVLAFVLSSQSAYACSPAPGYPQTPQESLTSHATAFVGTVQDVQKDEGEMGEYHVTFSVQASLKGDVGSTTTVSTRATSAACGYDEGSSLFKKGTIWAIFANGSSTAGYTTNSISSNTEYPSVSTALAALNAQATATSTMPTTDLTVGSRGMGVTWLQNYLMQQVAGARAQALSAAGATGYFGQLTRSALAEYQTAHNITPAQGYFGAKTRAAIGSTQIQTPDSGSATTFTGKIESVDTGCFADATCSVTVGGKKVVLQTGMRVGMFLVPTGTLIGVDSIGDLEKKIGSTVRVYAAELSDGTGYTLIGSSNYYVALVGDVPPAGAISIKGTGACLPVRDPQKIHTLICAEGLKGDDGNYYALKDTNESYANISKITSDQRVLVTGTFTPGASDVYANVGTVEVKDVSVEK